MNRRNGVRVAFGLLGLVAVSSATGLAATPASPVVPAGMTFSYTDAEQSYVVPADVTMVQAEARGGAGQTANPQPGPGDGMDLSVGLPVIPGETLFAEVGAPGGASRFGGGGAGGTGSGAAGGAGGGASDVRFCSIAATSCPGGVTSAGSRLLVAGGGGGSGGGPPPSTVDLGDACGADTGGGDAAGSTPVSVPGGTALAGGDDIIIDEVPGDAVATGGSGTAPGMGGTIPDCSGGGRTLSGSVSGANGSGATGGAGGSGPGGGGGGAGGGYFGGGGGPSGQTETAGHPGTVSDGSGGAAGSSFFATSDTGIISYQNASANPPQVKITPLIVIASPARDATFSEGQVVDASYACLDGCVQATVANRSPIDTSTPGVHSFQVGDQLQSWPVALSTITYTVAAAKPPAVRITSAKVSEHTAKFSFAAVGGTATSFQCALERGATKHAVRAAAGSPAFATCRSPKLYRGLKAGSYTFSVRAVGAGGTSAAAVHRFAVP